MSEKLNYLECWINVAASLLSQAMAGDSRLEESLPKPLSREAFGFVSTIEGDEAGRFAVMLDGGMLELPLLGEGIDQRGAWAELIREISNAAAGEVLAKTGRACGVSAFSTTEGESKLTRAFQLTSGERSWPIQINSSVEETKGSRPAVADPFGNSAGSRNKPPLRDELAGGIGSSLPGVAEGVSPDHNWERRSAPGVQVGDPDLSRQKLSPGLELLLDVELEASLRFGAREMPLGELLELGPGDVVQLDRHITDPVELIIGDKIVARGEVVLVDGNFGLRITQVAAPESRLQSIRCLF